MSSEAGPMNLGSSNALCACSPCGHVFREDWIKAKFRGSRAPRCPTCGTFVDARTIRTIYLELPAGEQNQDEQRRNEIAALQNQLAQAKSNLKKYQVRAERAEMGIAKLESLITSAKHYQRNKGAGINSRQSQPPAQPQLVLVKK